MTVQIRRDDLHNPRVIALIQAHHAHSNAHSPATSVHTLDINALRAPDVAFFVLWQGDDPLATGGLKTLSPQSGEVKSMHVSDSARGQGLGRQMLAHLEGYALGLGMQDLWLETGSMAAYAPARTLYSRAGFQICAPFADYRLDPNSVYMTKPLVAEAAQSPDQI